MLEGAEDPPTESKNKSDTNPSLSGTQLVSITYIHAYVDR